jgi:hypothetical protein
MRQKKKEHYKLRNYKEEGRLILARDTVKFESSATLL